MKCQTLSRKFTQESKNGQKLVDPGREFVGSVTVLMNEKKLVIKDRKLLITEHKHSSRERTKHWEKKYLVNNMLTKC